MRFLRPFEIEPTEYVDGVIISAIVETSEVIVDFDLSHGSIRDINPFKAPLSKWRCEATLHPDVQEITWFVDSVSFDGFYYEYVDDDGNLFDGSVSRQVVAYTSRDINDPFYTNRNATSIVVSVFDKGSANPEDWHFQISNLND